MFLQLLLTKIILFLSIIIFAKIDREGLIERGGLLETIIDWNSKVWITLKAVFYKKILTVTCRFFNPSYSKGGGGGGWANIPHVFRE